MNNPRMPQHGNTQGAGLRPCRTFVVALAISFLIPPTTLKPQTNRLSGVSVSIERISVEQGLSYRSVNAITQDWQGFIWIGTQDGLNRFDGHNFTVYRNNPSDSTSLSNSYVWSLYVDKAGTLWVGTQNGLNSLDPLTNTWTRYFHDPSNALSLSNNEIRCMYEDRVGAFWVGTTRGLNRLDKHSRTWTRLFPVPDDSTLSGNNFIDVVLEDREGCFWIGTGNFNIAGGGLCRLDRKSGKIKHFQHEPRNYMSLPNNWVTSMLEDSSGALWIGTEGGICTFNRSSNTFTLHPIPYKGPQSVNRLFVKSMCQDRTGALWVSTFGWGALRYEKESKSFLQYTYDARDPLSIGSPYVTTLFVDRAGLLWAGTWGGGVDILGIRPFVYYHALANLQFMKSGATALQEDEHGALYIGTGSNGAWRYGPAKQELLCLPMPPIYNPLALPSTTTGSAARAINSLREDKAGSIWIGSWNSGELLRYDPVANVSSVVFRTPNVSSGGRELINNFLIDDDRAMWICSDERLSKVDKDGTVHQIYIHDARSAQTTNPGDISSILRDRSGILWVGTSTGVLRFEKGNGSFVKFARDEMNASSLSNSTVWCIFEDHFGRLWVGTEDGLNRFVPTTGTFVRYTIKEGLAGRTIMSIQEDENGNLWVATEAGISCVNPDTRAVVNYDQSDGLPATEYSEGCALRRKNGELLFGTNTGILAFHPVEVKPSNYIPAIVVIGIKTSKRVISLSTSPDLVHEVSVEHGEDVFSVEFAALSYENRRFNHYAYKLEGFDNDWVDCGNRREAMYTNLDPGAYTFRVKGSNHDRVWNEAGTSLTVIVKPAYWQTWWFRTLVVLAVICITVTLVQLRMRRILAQERIRLQIASDLHDDLGSSLSSIALVSENVSSALGENHPALRDLRSLTSTAREAADRLKDDVWVIKPGSDTLENLLLKMKDVTQSLIGHIQHSFRAEMNGTSRQVPLSFRRNILFIYKETLHNILKHSSASSVEIQLGLEDGSFTLDVRDTGKGFDPASVRKGNGLINLQRRADALKGDLLIRSAKDKGTHVRLKVRIP